MDTKHPDIINYGCVRFVNPGIVVLPYYASLKDRQNALKCAVLENNPKAKQLIQLSIKHMKQ